MINKCEVVLNNSAVTVVKYEEGHLIQFPAINKPDKYVLVKNDNDAYVIVDEDESETLGKKSKK